MTTYTIQMRRLVETNTDPQRRCYHGVHARSEWQWTAWEDLLFEVPEEKLEGYLTWWRDLNAYAVGERGKSATKEFRAIIEE